MQDQRASTPYLLRGANLGASSRYARESNEKRGRKIRKLIWDGDAVKVSASYQWATAGVLVWILMCMCDGMVHKSICYVPYEDRPRIMMAKTA